MNFSIERAMALQKILAEKALKDTLSVKPVNLDRVRFIAGFDSAYRDDRQYAVVVVYDTVSKLIVQRVFDVVQARVPYIPGLLAFREVPGYMRAYSKLSVEPDILVVDGHGLSHPRAFGIATHLGLVIGKPSIGVAKRRLYGEVLEQDGKKLIRAHGLIVGEVLKHEDTDLYVSIGYMIRLDDAVNIIKSMLVKGKKLPTPLEEADTYSKMIKRKYY